MKQLKRHNKPMFLFNIGGYFEPLMQMLKHSINENTVKPEHLELFEMADSSVELLEKIRNSKTS
jgi:predicted Rossmann-fold nucleotide-binding protein